MYLKKAGLDGSSQSTITGNIKDYKKGDGYLRWRAYEVTDQAKPC